MQWDFHVCVDLKGLHVHVWTSWVCMYMYVCAVGPHGFACTCMCVQWDLMGLHVHVCVCSRTSWVCMYMYVCAVGPHGFACTCMRVQWDLMGLHVHVCVCSGT